MLERSKIHNYLTISKGKIRSGDIRGQIQIKNGTCNSSLCICARMWWFCPIAWIHRLECKHRHVYCCTSVNKFMCVGNIHVCEMYSNIRAGNPKTRKKPNQCTNSSVCCAPPFKRYMDYVTNYLSLKIQENK